MTVLELQATSQCCVRWASQKGRRSCCCWRSLQHRCRKQREHRMYAPVSSTFTSCGTSRSGSCMLAPSAMSRSSHNPYMPSLDMHTKSPAANRNSLT